LQGRNHLPIGPQAKLLASELNEQQSDDNGQNRGR
jgi:hypothetical protein